MPSPDRVWADLADHLTKWFHDPDLEAFRIVLSACVSHYYSTEKPVWLLVFGDSGSGKSEVLGSAFSVLPESWLVGDLGPRSFLSSWQKGKNNSMLEAQTLAHNRADGTAFRSAVWIAKDFTTLFSLHHDDRNKVFAALREIWDGSFSRKTGVGPPLFWEGKITFLALATPEVESHWSSIRGLGERFLTLQWRSSDPFAAMRKARAQFGHEREISARLKDLTLQLYSGLGSTAVENPDSRDPGILDQMDSLAHLVAWLRVHVPRTSENSRSITRVPKPEFPTRISMALYQVARTHAALFGRQISLEDLELSRRLAVDSVPWVRTQILSWIPHSGAEISYGDLMLKTRVPKTTLLRELENLVALGVLDEGPGWTTEWTLQSVGLSGDFRLRLAQSGLRLDRTPVPVVIKPKVSGL